MSEHIAVHAAKGAAHIVKNLEPLHEQKSPVLAFILGFFFGALGVAIYFRSIKDFFICMAIFIVMTLLVPFGPGELLGWLFSPCYGAWRAFTSNDNL